MIRALPPLCPLLNPRIFCRLDLPGIEGQAFTPHNSPWDKSRHWREALLTFSRIEFRTVPLLLLPHKLDELSLFSLLRSMRTWPTRRPSSSSLVPGPKSFPREAPCEWRSSSQSPQPPSVLLLTAQLPPAPFPYGLARPRSLPPPLGLLSIPK